MMYDSTSSAAMIDSFNLINNRLCIHSCKSIDVLTCLIFLTDMECIFKFEIIKKKKKIRMQAIHRLRYWMASSTLIEKTDILLDNLNMHYVFNRATN